MSSGGDTASPGSALWWFSSDVDGASGPSGWRLDVVTLLAVIGEGSIAEHAQTITASVFCLLPRIIPAPQALVKPSRPVRLPETTAKMTGVYSGVVLDTVGFFANIIHPLDELQPFSFKVLEIKHANREPDTNGSNLLSRLRTGLRSNTNMSKTRSVRLTGPPPDAHDEGSSKTPPGGTTFSSSADVEAATPAPGIRKRATMKEKVQDFVTNPTGANDIKRPAIPAKLYSPIHILEIFSALLTFSIIGFAVKYQDGTAILAVSLIALASSIVGWASWWKPILMNRIQKNKVPAGDVVIRTREGAFLLVKCTEEVARELYSGTEECEYHVSGQAYRVLMGIGTLLLMVSVILLGNCKWKTQIFIGVSYITLNGMYWTMGLLPKRYFWDLSRYTYRDITPPHAKNADKQTDTPDPREGMKSFTRTLWYVIRETKRTAWVGRSGAAPSTPQWRRWLAEAEEAAIKGNINWPSVARKDEIMNMRDGDDVSRSPIPEGQFDEAEQAAPAVEVQPQNRRASQTGAF
ncbi:Uu.00g123800.m01.CDS01 [Anthostomella pinea]|uniref:Uu.00g123800.m01.CDS01 n=1 Tax=Anthostomella pinea TaxID=933095 RepID=A0AAI8VI03_9PEZI|nr:Uu.00g123800.m01.CDS01 [Anthostomella pinea]